VLTRHLTAEPPALPASVDSAIVDLVLLLMRKNRDERVQSAGELLDRIDRILAAPAASGGVPAVPASGARLARPGTMSSSELTVVDATEPGPGFAPTVFGESVSGLSCASTAIAWRAASCASLTRGCGAGAAAPPW